MRGKRISRPSWFLLPFKLAVKQLFHDRGQFLQECDKAICIRQEFWNFLINAAEILSDSTLSQDSINHRTISERMLSMENYKFKESEVSLAKIELNSQGDYVMVSTDDSTLFDRLSFLNT